MKRSLLSILLANVGIVTLLLISGCGGRPREVQVTSNSRPGFVDAQMWTDQSGYSFGDPVTLGVTLTNVSAEPLILQSQSGTEAIVDIDVSAIRNIGEDRVIFQWSNENPDQVERTVSLEPGSSYVVTWTLQLPVRAVYSIVGWWADSRGRYSMVLGIEYGAGPPSP